MLGDFSQSRLVVIMNDLARFDYKSTATALLKTKVKVGWV